MSLPSRERGLKFCISGHCTRCIKSLPSRERGLKCDGNEGNPDKGLVAPLAGAWIEIANKARKPLAKHRRSPRGSVD